jgi:hypothetical protein
MDILPSFCSKMGSYYKEEIFNEHRPLVGAEGEGEKVSEGVQ